MSHQFGLHCDLHCPLNNTIPLPVQIEVAHPQLAHMRLTVWYVRRDNAGAMITSGPTKCYYNATLDQVHSGGAPSHDGAISFNNRTNYFEFSPHNNGGVYEIVFHAWDDQAPPVSLRPHHFFHHPVRVHVP